MFHVTTLGKLFTHNVPLFTKQYKLVPAIGWEGNRRSGVALAMRHRLSGISTYRLNGLQKGHEPKLHSEYTASLPLLHPLTSNSTEVKSTQDNFV